MNMMKGFASLLFIALFALTACGGGGDSPSSTPAAAPAAVTTTVTTVATGFYGPYGVTTDGINLYVADTSNHAIKKIVISTGVVTTLAGTVGTSGSADGTGAAALFYAPMGITTDGTNLYVADFLNRTIRQIVISTGVVTTLAGTVGVSGSTDGTGTAASFTLPRGVIRDGANLYVADTSNSTIRKIVIATGVVTTFAGTVGTSGSTDGTGTAAQFSYPDNITTDGTNLYVADTGNHRIRKIVISSAVVTTLAGAGNGSADGTGTAATFNSPAGITIAGTNLYVSDTGNHTIRKIVIATGVVTTPVGSAGNPGSTDGVGSAARFYNPRGIIADGTNLYVADSSNNAIRKIQ
ncbi:MAG: hypothetical protein HY886_07980 [Deltaproteobacteria bacterium]|nr:hypothetical protein [Deltaproteobacteria bacterium]